MRAANGRQETVKRVRDHNDVIPFVLVWKSNRRKMHTFIKCNDKIIIFYQNLGCCFCLSYCVCVFFCVVSLPILFGACLLSWQSCGFAYVLLHRSLIINGSVCIFFFAIVVVASSNHHHHHANGFFSTNTICNLLAFFFVLLLFFSLLFQIWFQAIFFYLAAAADNAHSRNRFHICTTRTIARAKNKTATTKQNIYTQRKKTWWIKNDKINWNAISIYSDFQLVKVSP